MQHFLDKMLATFERVGAQPWPRQACDYCGTPFADDDYVHMQRIKSEADMIVLRGQQEENQQ
jgi:hypothetical protein